MPPPLVLGDDGAAPPQAVGAGGGASSPVLIYTVEVAPPPPEVSSCLLKAESRRSSGHPHDDRTHLAVHIDPRVEIVSPKSGSVSTEWIRLAGLSQAGDCNNARYLAAACGQGSGICMHKTRLREDQGPATPPTTTTNASTLGIDTRCTVVLASPPLGRARSVSPSLSPSLSMGSASPSDTCGDGSVSSSARTSPTTSCRSDGAAVAFETPAPAAAPCKPPPTKKKKCRGAPAGLCIPHAARRDARLEQRLPCAITVKKVAMLDTATASPCVRVVCGEEESSSCGQRTPSSIPTSRGSIETAGATSTASLVSAVSAAAAPQQQPAACAPTATRKACVPRSKKPQPLCIPQATRRGERCTRLPIVCMIRKGEDAGAAADEHELAPESPTSPPTPLDEITAEQRCKEGDATATTAASSSTCKPMEAAAQSCPVSAPAPACKVDAKRKKQRSPPPLAIPQAARRDARLDNMPMAAVIKKVVEAREQCPCYDDPAAAPTPGGTGYDAPVATPGISESGGYQGGAAWWGAYSSPQESPNHSPQHGPVTSPTGPPCGHGPMPASFPRIPVTQQRRDNPALNTVNRRGSPPSCQLLASPPGIVPKKIVICADFASPCDDEPEAAPTPGGANSGPVGGWWGPYGDIDAPGDHTTGDDGGRTPPDDDELADLQALIGSSHDTRPASAVPLPAAVKPLARCGCSSSSNNSNTSSSSNAGDGKRKKQRSPPPLAIPQAARRDARMDKTPCATVVIKVPPLPSDDGALTLACLSPGGAPDAAKQDLWWASCAAGAAAASAESSEITDDGPCDCGGADCACDAPAAEGAAPACGGCCGRDPLAAASAVATAPDNSSAYALRQKMRTLGIGVYAASAATEHLEAISAAGCKCGCKCATGCAAAADAIAAGARSGNNNSPTNAAMRGRTPVTVWIIDGDDVAEAVRKDVAALLALDHCNTLRTIECFYAEAPTGGPPQLWLVQEYARTTLNEVLCSRRIMASRERIRRRAEAAAAAATDDVTPYIPTQPLVDIEHVDQPLVAVVATHVLRALAYLGTLRGANPALDLTPLSLCLAVPQGLVKLADSTGAERLHRNPGKQGYIDDVMPSYKSAERLAGHPRGECDLKSDVASLGIIALDLALRSHPLTAYDLAEHTPAPDAVRLAATRGLHGNVHDLLPESAGDLAAFVTAALEPDPGVRPTAGDLLSTSTFLAKHKDVVEGGGLPAMFEALLRTP